MKRLVAATVGERLIIECRKFVAEALEELACADPDGWIVLLADELIANAIEAGTEHFELTVVHDGVDTIRLSVIDDAPGLPYLRHPGPDDERGRGLQLVNRLAEAWGTRPAERGKETWFDFKAPHVAPSERELAIAGG